MTNALLQGEYRDRQLHICPTGTSDKYRYFQVPSVVPVPVYADTCSGFLNSPFDIGNTSKLIFPKTFWNYFKASSKCQAGPHYHREPPQTSSPSTKSRDHSRMRFSSSLFLCLKALPLPNPLHPTVISLNSLLPFSCEFTGLHQAIWCPEERNFTS